MPDALNPSAALLVKLGSMIVHAENFISLRALTFDLTEFLALRQDPEVDAWLKSMRAQSFIPERR